MVENERYLIPLDNSEFKKSVIAEELLMHVVNGRQRSILNFDYSALEAEGEKFENNMMEVREIFDDQH